MTYSLDRPSGVERQLRAIADYQLGAALDELERSGTEREKIVHDVRLRCKKLRGLIRLVRPAFADYKAENAAFRAVAHLFEDLRDAKVMQDTYDLLIGAFEDQVDRTAFASVRREMTSRRKAVLARADWDALRGEARARLEEARRRAAGWRLEEQGWEALEGGLAKTHSRAVEAMDEAVKAPTGPRLHEWRKRAKYHWYHTRLLKHSFPDTLKPRARAIKQLSDLLGDHHDIHVFVETLEGEPGAFGEAETIALLRAMAERRSAALETEARALGEKVLAESTDALVDRIGSYWHAWEAEEKRSNAA
ncbi:CHAD domain-containing protein [Erythrobacter sp.]|uniref:CHAD domain-containing protein n=1 Tax=Erythrobacter sp. TaxID=1042 RepID=UPI001425DF1D|nr:CHAD domain-containing protein [Erythrobacter sp.]QIQ85622.1 MAG: CHAD domain-containing protein [Erythrobacter sp.]